MVQKERLRTQEYTFTAVFEPEPEGGYTVHFPALRGCITYGETLDQARDTAREALALYLESLLEDDVPIPDDTAPNRFESRSGFS